MKDLLTLADIPALDAGRSPTSEITVARLGKYHDPRYGNFKISRQDYEGWERNLSDTFGGKVAIDFDHSSDRGKGTEAAGWITGLSLAGDDVKANVEWTPKGAAAIRDKAYQYVSPTFVEDYKNERGESRGRALLGAAATNRPVLRELPTLSLSRDQVDGVAVPRKGKKKRAGERKRARAQLLARLSDSRASMEFPDLIKALDLAEDADTAAVVSKVIELANGTQPAPPKAASVPKPKKKKGKKGKNGSKVTMALSTEETAELITAANAGQAAALQLSEERFEGAWTKALSEGRAAPSQEETMRALWRENQDLAVKTLDSFVRIVPTVPTGSGDGGGPGGPAPAGVDPGRFELHQMAQTRAKTLARENDSLTPDEAYAQAAIEIEEREARNSAGVMF